VTLLVLLAGLFGLAVGSFLNVVIYRVPAGESVVRPPSHCRGCGAAVAPRDNLPVLSWLLLRGRARCCGDPVSVRYPLVEAATGLAFAGVTGWVLGLADGDGWPLNAGPSPVLGMTSPGDWVALVGLLYFAAVSIALAMIDIDTFRLPAVIVWISWAVGAVTLGGAALLSGQPQAAVRTVAGGLALWSLYRLLHLIYPAGMGYGDVRLAGLIGGYLAFFSWQVLLAGAFLGFLVGGVVGVVLILVKRSSLRAHIPYGPYMLTGAWLGLLVGQPVMSAYLRLTGLT
jgi:leader peptidase (prepilin peptidase)/N-methyltransferase